MKKRLAVFASGSGTNFENIAKSIKRRTIKNADIVLLVCDVPNAYVLKRAQQYRIPSLVIPPKQFKNKAAYERAILAALKEVKAQYLVLSGYMRLVGPVLLGAYKNKIINVHPALLPSFKGMHGIQDAYKAGVKVSGVTVHFVNADLDAGPIILQKAVEIKKGDTLAVFEKNIHQAEHELYPQAINLLVNNKLRISGNKVKLCARKREKVKRKK